ncbi:hypothetical protein Tdes44962_MAKER05840 [Teratosphaeria destructans]|uniref:Uncharacterized protein n=1 Tax=Teratosphaeria destructans TaxID=418781 RepID=A0A9W7SIT5_9PEZI|nr:hypothetical protein Tdes44962_MAKER05840 [Teratosphaeria destructans]
MAQPYTGLRCIDCSAVAFNATTAPEIFFLCSHTPSSRRVANVFVLSANAATDSAIVHPNA